MFLEQPTTSAALGLERGAQIPLSYFGSIMDSGQTAAGGGLQGFILVM